MTYLLDTTVLIDTLRARNNRRALLAELVRQGHTLSTTAMNIAEVHAGMRPSERDQTEAFLDQLRCLPITAQIGRLAGDLKSSYARKGETLQLPDMIIAATALENGLTLITDNRKDFPIAELNLYNLP